MPLLATSIVVLAIESKALEIGMEGIIAEEEMLGLLEVNVESLENFRI